MKHSNTRARTRIAIALGLALAAGGALADHGNARVDDASRWQRDVETARANDDVYRGQGRARPYDEVRRDDRDASHLRDIRGDRDDRWDRHGPPRWETLASLRTHRDGRSHETIRLPYGTRALRLAAVDRRVDVRAAWVEYADGSRDRLERLEGRLDGRGDAFARLVRPSRGHAVLHLVTAPVRDGRRGYFDLLAAR